jgi:hypothetical protein
LANNLPDPLDLCGKGAGRRGSQEVLLAGTGTVQRFHTQHSTFKL